MTADTQLPLWDFAEDFQANPEPALQRLLALVLDRQAVRRRVAELRACADAGAAEFTAPDTDGTDPAGFAGCQAFAAPASACSAGKPAEGPRKPDTRANLAEAVALVCGAQVLPLYREGRLTEEHVWQLHRLTCDADALLDAHRRLVEEDAAAPTAVEVPTRVFEETRFGVPITGFTVLARTGRLADLEERLRPWLPFLLRRAGLTADLDDALARQFLTFLRGRMADVQHRGFRDLFPVWVQDFARARGATGQVHADGLLLSGEEVEADAVERVLRRPGEGESPWARSYREAALHAPVRTARDLLTFETPHVRDVSCLPNYRRDLFLEARQVLRDGLELFECEAAG